ncbi:hypothetical protein BD324DRAFT_582684 [Kockovaella imperatae]|uniref:AraC-type arabinose-binding/dimerisation domain-containing protein n=1 Tax=Kockovaella imperatae TaxID=4999 RepID=A0A1Y1UBN8_9TREE|nr:hypothetical protein BD324DRAFT_582684 [Kockovaella imperatae]ORX34944.1 hypothetical protein BD324DRAFT_582684 [Kockovaella imperatae]
MRLTPLSQLNTTRRHIQAHGLIPNTSSCHPLVIYHSAFPPTVTATDIESHLRHIDVVVPAWRYTMYSFDHFHATTHEVLCVYSGQAKLCFGGETNPDRVLINAQKGDVILLPAGVCHRLLEELEKPFMMVGSYPHEKRPDMCYGIETEEESIRKIADLGWFETDPIYGGGSDDN